jgi:hypothetical protein
MLKNGQNGKVCIGKEGLLSDFENPKIVKDVIWRFHIFEQE